MQAKIFINLPVSDLKRSMAFFRKLYFKFNQKFTDENATCMSVSENIYIMLLVNSFFSSFSKKEICDTAEQAEVIVALSADSRSRVDDLANRAIAAGAIPVSEPEDQGFMYSRSFEDLDGHLWEVIYMDPAAVK
jgi:predicted lactoylglutathione lyase